MERRLIDANALEAEFAGPFVQTYKDCREALRGAPTIDAVEVVRCRECRKHREKGCLNIVWCDKWGNVVGMDDFCSYGERREPDGK